MNQYDPQAYNVSKAHYNNSHNGYNTTTCMNRGEVVGVPNYNSTTSTNKPPPSFSTFYSSYDNSHYDISFSSMTAPPNNLPTSNIGNSYGCGPTKAIPPQNPGVGSGGHFPASSYPPSSSSTYDVGCSSSTGTYNNSALLYTSEYIHNDSTISSSYSSSAPFTTAYSSTYTSAPYTSVSTYAPQASPSSGSQLTTYSYSSTTSYPPSYSSTYGGERYGNDEYRVASKPTDVYGARHGYYADTHQQPRSGDNIYGPTPWNSSYSTAVNKYTTSYYGGGLPSGPSSCSFPNSSTLPSSVPPTTTSASTSTAPPTSAAAGFTCAATAWTGAGAHTPQPMQGDGSTRPPRYYGRYDACHPQPRSDDPRYSPAVTPPRNLKNGRRYDSSEKSRDRGGTQYRRHNVLGRTVPKP